MGKLLYAAGHILEMDKCSQRGASTNLMFRPHSTRPSWARSTSHLSRHETAALLSKSRKTTTSSFIRTVLRPSPLIGNCHRDHQHINTNDASPSSPKTHSAASTCSQQGTERLTGMWHWPSLFYDVHQHPSRVMLATLCYESTLKYASKKKGKKASAKGSCRLIETLNRKRPERATWPKAV